MDELSRVVQVPTLADFVEQVWGRPDGYVYLMLSEKWTGGQIPQKEIALDLHGVNQRGEIVWLHDSHRVMWAQREPAFERDASVYEGMKTVYDLVKDELGTLGYAVRPGRYGVPDSIKPMRGAFECVRWVKEGENKFRVEAVENWAEDEG